MLLPTRSAMIVVFSEVRPSLELNEMPSSATTATVIRRAGNFDTFTHDAGRAKLKAELLL